MLAKNTDDKYRKSRKNNKFNKIQDLEREEAKKGLEMSANVAKSQKKEDFCRWLKPPRTNITEITNKSEFLQIGTILVVIDVAMKFLFLLQILRNWRTTRGPSLPLFCC